MTSKERLMCALNREKPNRLPVSVHQWQGYHLDTYLDGISDVEAFKKFGMDGQIQYFEDMGQFWLVDADYTKASTPQWRDEDLELIRKYMPVPKLDLKPLEAFYANVGDAGIVRGFVWGDQAGCWQHAACLKDVTELIFKAMDDPAWVHQLLQILLDKKLEFIESMKGAKFDLVETGGGSGSSTLISPDLHEEFCLPYDRKMHDALHGLGFKVTYHTCGGTFGIEEHIVANGCDASETLAAPSIGGNQKPWEYKEKIGNRIALIGGMDQFNVLSRGTPEAIRTQVHTLFENVGYEGGYILSCADHFFDTPVENIEAYADAARECIYA